MSNEFQAQIPTQTDSSIDIRKISEQKHLGSYIQIHTNDGQVSEGFLVTRHDAITEVYNPKTKEIEQVNTNYRNIENITGKLDKSSPLTFDINNTIQDSLDKNKVFIPGKKIFMQLDHLDSDLNFVKSLAFGVIESYEDDVVTINNTINNKGILSKIDLRLPESYRVAIYSPKPCWIDSVMDGQHSLDLIDKDEKDRLAVSLELGEDLLKKKINPFNNPKLYKFLETRISIVEHVLKERVSPLEFRERYSEFSNLGNLALALFHPGIAQRYQQYLDFLSDIDEQTRVKYQEDPILAITAFSKHIEALEGSTKKAYRGLGISSSEAENIMNEGMYAPAALLDNLHLRIAQLLSPYPSQYGYLTNSIFQDIYHNKQVSYSQIFTGKKEPYLTLSITNYEKIAEAVGSRYGNRQPKSKVKDILTRTKKDDKELYVFELGVSPLDVLSISHSSMEVVVDGVSYKGREIEQFIPFFIPPENIISKTIVSNPSTFTLKELPRES